MDVLLVDDNPLMQQLIARFLGELGYRVRAAGSAAEAVALAHKTAPGLFIIDMHLPDLDGPEALQELRALPGCALTPAIAISGLAQEELRHLIARDFVEYLVKPLDLDLLEATVAQHLGANRERSVG